MDVEMMKHRSELFSNKYLTTFNFLSKYERFGMICLIVLILAILFIIIDIQQNVYVACVFSMSIISVFFIYKIFDMTRKKKNVSLQQIMSKTFTMFMTLIILMLFTLYCISDTQEDLDNMPDGWKMFVRIFMGILIVQSIIGFSTLFLTTPENHWILCTIGAIGNISLFIFLLIIYTIFAYFRTDGFLV